MAKKKSGAQKTAVRKQEQRAEAKEQARRAEAVRKNRQMSKLFLFVLFGMVGAVCLIYTVKTFFFPASELKAMRNDYLLTSVFAIPYLIATVAVVLRKLLKKRVERFSDAGKRGCTVLFVAACLGAALLFGAQAMTGRTEVEDHKACAALTEALNASGQAVTLPEQKAAGFVSALEKMSLITDRIGCGSSFVRLHYHEGGMGIPGRFVTQTGKDYAFLQSVREEIGDVAVTRFIPMDLGGLSFAALALQNADASVVYELSGPMDELKALLPLLEQAGLRTLGAAD